MNKPHWQTVLTSVGAPLNIALLLIFAPHGMMPLVLCFAKVLIMFPVSVYISTKLGRKKIAIFENYPAVYFLFCAYGRRTFI